MNKEAGYIFLLGSAWGLAECALGAGLKVCASSLSGSVMTGAAFFFVAAAWGRGRKFPNVILLVSIATVFKMFDAFWLGVPLRSGAIANPVFAFVLEGAAFLLAGSVLAASMKTRAAGRAVWGGGAALIAVGAFPLVRFVTGIPACVVAGSSFPLVWAYAPIAVGLSLLTVPFGLRAGESARRMAPGPAWSVPVAVALFLAAAAVVRVF